MAAIESFDDSSDEFAANTSVSAPVNKIDNDLASSSYYSDEEEKVLDEVRSPSVDNSILDTSNDMPHIDKLSEKNAKEQVKFGSILPCLLMVKWLDVSVEWNSCIVVQLPL